MRICVWLHVLVFGVLWLYWFHVWSPGTRRSNVAIIGAGGYIGSKLHEALAAHSNLNVTGFDRDPRLERPVPPVTKLAAQDIPTSDLLGFDVVIYLGGLTGRAACKRHTKREILHENVGDLVNLASRMNGTQLLVFASTSALMEGSGYKPAGEEGPINTKLLDRYARSMAEREKAMRRLSSNTGTPQLIGLRFGTVLGSSP